MIGLEDRQALAQDIATAGRPIGHVHLPERCANLCFGGKHHNRLFMAASHSVYALAVNVQGAR